MMNAYELADALHSPFKQTEGYCKTVKEVSTMLRQQADRIAELEKSHIELEKGILKKLNQEMMSKPVAWQREDGVIAFHEKPQLDSQGFKWRSLYTHPHKQLSEKRIAEIWAEHTKIAGTYGAKDIILPFANAIIKEITE